MEISKEAILDKTHYGLKIYAHVLKHYYGASAKSDDTMISPDTANDVENAVLSLSGKDCLPTRNPFNDDKPTLKIQIVNNCGVHFDLENSISCGDAFDFAALHYGLQGKDLYHKLNNELFLNIIPRASIISSNNAAIIEKPIQLPIKNPIPFFSYFKAPVTNTVPNKEINLVQVYQLLKSNDFTERTNTLRSITDKQEARKYKASQFDYVTFSGSFSKRNDKSLLRHSGLITVDFDHIEDIAWLKEKLLQDEYFETELLFVSPSGDGLKWIIPIALTKAKQQDFFKAVANYIRHTYQLEVDQSGKDASRACFLPQDAAPFINPKYL